MAVEPALITTGIAAVAAVAGAAIAALASYLNTRHKIRELEHAASQRMRENYLQNAREYSKAIYIPLALMISSLSDAYESFQRSPVASGPLDSFREAIDKFEREVKLLRDHGAEAFLTNELEDRLRSFTEFLRASRDATTIARRAEIGFRIGFGGMAWGETNAVSLVGNAATWWRSPKMSLSLPGIGFTYEAIVIQFAPPGTKEFALRFTADSGAIRFLIKEVTLGGKPRG